MHAADYTLFFVFADIGHVQSCAFTKTIDRNVMHRKLLPYPFWSTVRMGIPFLVVPLLRLFLVLVAIRFIVGTGKAPEIPHHNCGGLQSFRAVTAVTKKCD